MAFNPDTYEKKFCWVQRNLLNIEDDLFDFKRESLKEISFFWRRVNSSVNSVLDAFREYGADFLGIEWGVFQNILKKPKIKTYTGDPLKELEDDFFDQIKNFAEHISDFWDEFTETIDSWKEYHRSKVAQNRLFLGIVLTLVSEVILNFVFNFLLK